MGHKKIEIATIIGIFVLGSQSVALGASSVSSSEAKRVKFLVALAHRESTDDKTVINPFGYVGLFQMGGDALVDAQFYQLGPARNHNAWDGKITSRAAFVDVKSLQDYRNSAGAQELAVRAYHDVQWERLVRLGGSAAAETVISGINVTQSGLIAGAHLVGVGGVLRWVRSQGADDPLDGNQVPVSDYVQEFSPFY